MTLKTFYFAATLIILLLSAAFLGYGIYLNSTSDSHIETMLASRAVKLSGVKVSYRDLYPELYLDYIGLRARMQADAIARIDGMIEELYVSQGQEIKQGQPLCKIVNNDVPLSISRADTDIAKAEASYLQAMSTVERNKRLAAEDAIPASELEMSVSQMTAAKAELDAARITRKQMEDQRKSQVLTAPLSGSVIVVYQQAGNVVAKGAPVVMIADFTKMYFTALVDDKKMRNLTPLDGGFSLCIDMANMTEKAFDSAAKSSFSEETVFDVQISGIAPPLSESVPVRSLTFEIDNRLGVMEIGMYTDIIIRKNSPKRALAVPLNVIPDQDNPSVGVSDAESRLAIRKIKTGVYDSDYVEVLEGLEEGDVVITSGIGGLEAGMKVNVDFAGGEETGSERMR
ncbi:MAG: efflux RND transporter periplasmic adaptor subunit [Synergistaceae bacterium]|jgi:RND family efflux transporter MFP subunit|nr:efflux RND transporter periplasmic adaptor subunit [Synergistaceae bacterium]